MDVNANIPAIPIRLALNRTARTQHTANTCERKYKQQQQTNLSFG